MNTNELTNDAKAILLLCGRFGQYDSSESAKPLTIDEYNRLVDWLLSKNMRPANLLEQAPKEVLAESPLAIEIDRIAKLLSRGAALALAVEKWFNKGIWVVCRSDSYYPDRLKRHLKKNAPPILFGVGDLQLLSRGGLAVVGSRNIDPQGEAFTREVGLHCGHQGIQIVSGGARGVDQIAMLTALESGGTVVGVLADGLIKAAVSGKYRDGIREKRLALISPYNPDARFNVGNAMARNKYIYALADFILVVASEYKKGGTWAGAQEELKRRNAKAVFVRDGSNVPKGNRELQRLGAVPFPELPWDESLLGLLQKAASGYHTPAGLQGDLFDEAHYQSPLPATIAVKEEIETYDSDLNRGQEKANYIPASIYDAILPLLLKALGEWKNPGDLCSELNVRKGQLNDWLKRALKEGRIEKRNKPVRYRQADKR